MKKDLNELNNTENQAGEIAQNRNAWSIIVMLSIIHHTMSKLLDGKCQ